MGISWDGVGINCYEMGWDGTEKYVPWTNLAILPYFYVIFSSLSSLYFSCEHVHLNKDYFCIHLTW